MKKTEKDEKMVCMCHKKTPKELYEVASEEQKTVFRDAFLAFTGMPYTTFYYKVRTNSFRPLEEKAFYEILEKCPLMSVAL